MKLWMTLSVLCLAVWGAAPAKAADTTQEESNAVTVQEAAPAEAGAADVPLEQRLAVLEKELADVKAQLAGQQGKLETCCPEPEKDCCGNPLPTLDTALYGNVYLQGRNRNTQLAPVGHDRFSDLDIYWGELGINTSYDDWSGKFSVLLDENEPSVKLNEAWAKWQRKDDPAYFQAGRVLVPFGNNTYYFPTYPAVNDLGYSTLRSVGGGWDNGKSAISAYLYNPPVDVTGQSNVMRDYTVVWDVSKQNPDECKDGWKFTVGYNSNLAAHDLRLTGATLTKRVPGYNAFGRYDFHSGDELVHVLADYTKATERFAAADLDANGDAIGDQPAALNTELVFEPETDTFYGINYQQTKEMRDYAGTRWGLMYGERLNKLAAYKLEFTHGIFNTFATGGQDDEDTLVGEIHLTF